MRHFAGFGCGFERRLGGVLSIRLNTSSGDGPGAGGLVFFMDNSQKGESLSAANAEAFNFETPRWVAGTHRPQCCAVKEGSDVASTRMIRR
jgi:hypothetical protein